MMDLSIAGMVVVLLATPLALACAAFVVFAEGGYDW